MKVKSGKTYVGVVEDNNDPQKLGRCRVRVFNVFDDVPLENIPWANPWKDLAGNGFALPEKGKVVTVVFENANPNSPEFISSDHFNINLEKKLQSLGEADYLSMKSLMFDHKTQVYVNDGEGLKLDHKFNVVNIRENSINVNLKDNFAKINLGTANSTQRAILGDNFLNWFDDFVQILMGSKGGPFLGNLGAPVVATPALLGSLQLYQQLKDPKFLSKNVYIVDNENVEKLDRIAEGQKGDTWQSTVQDNNVTSKEPVPYTPTPGSTNTTFEQPPMDAPPSPTQSVPEEAPKPKPTENPDIKIVKEVLKIKEYRLFSDIEKLNIVAVRNQCVLPGDKYTDLFSDKLYVIWLKEDNTWDIKQYKFSTVPGLEFTITDSWLTEKNLKSVEPWTNSTGKKIFMKEYASIAGQQNGDPVLKDGLPVLVPSQYIDTFYVSQYKGASALRVVSGASQLIWRDIDTTNIDTFNPKNLTTPELITPNDFVDNGIKIHLGYPGGTNVGSWSEGAQVFSSADNLNEFFGLCEKHRKKHGNVFSYTLVTKTDWDEATKNAEADKASDPLGPEQVVATQSSATQSGIAATQSQTQALVEKNKSEVIDVFSNGSLLIEITVANELKTGKITTDDIKKVISKGWDASEDSMNWYIKHDAIPGQWEFYSDSVTYKTPSGEGYGQSVNSLKKDKVVYEVLDQLDIQDWYDGLPGTENYLYGKYEAEVSITLNNTKKDFGSEDKQKTITKSIEFTIEKGSPSSSQGSNPDATSSNNNEYIIAILNPTTENSKKVNGKITFNKSGPKSQAIGTLEGFPDGGSIGPIIGAESFTADLNALANEMLIILQDEIIKKYQVNVKLVVVEKR